jgi:hypothetical protein
VEALLTHRSRPLRGTITMRQDQATFEDHEMPKHNFLPRSTPKPGTFGAQHSGCICPASANNHGDGKEPGVWLLTPNCPLHDPRD